MSAFRGFLTHGSFGSSIEPHLSGEEFSVSSSDIPNSTQYSLRDLIASGQKLAPTDTAILHDENAIGELMAHEEVLSNVEPSNE